MFQTKPIFEFSLQSGLINEVIQTPRLIRGRLVRYLSLDILEKYVLRPQDESAVCFPMPLIPTLAICTRHCIKSFLFLI